MQTLELYSSEFRDDFIDNLQEPLCSLNHYQTKNYEAFSKYQDCKETMEGILERGISQTLIYLWRFYLGKFTSNLYIHVCLHINLF